MPSTLTSACTICSVLAAHATFASAQITISSRTVQAEMTHTWYQEPLTRQTVVATDTAVRGPISLPTSTSDASQSPFLDVAGSLTGPGGLTATGTGDVSYASLLLSNPGFLRWTAGGGIGAGGTAPPFGQLVSTGTLTNILDFQTAAFTTWSSVTYLPLTSRPTRLVIVRDPNLPSQSTIFDLLFNHNGDPYIYAGGILSAGNYRATVSVHGQDASYGPPGSGFGSLAGGGLTLSVPTPGTAALLPALIACFRRRRA